MYKLIIFDFDGTLADTSPGILNSVRYTQKMMNLPEISEKSMYSHIGPPMAESYNRNFGLEGEELAQAVKYHKEYAVAQGYKELRFYDGITELLDKLRSTGVTTAIATLKAQDTAVKILDNFGMTEKFDIVEGVDISAPKNKEQIIMNCIDKVGCSVCDAVLIGDSVYDAKGAEQAGIDFIAVTYGFGFHSKADADAYRNVGCCSDVRSVTKLLFNQKK